mmetsp:Transcript_3085/g.7899  ORF Transcript_3085/g.7899 Transcript_3085/m.7899 type:complete len:210 (+) Transcript_3085:237-866(+)
MLAHDPIKLRVHVAFPKAGAHPPPVERALANKAHTLVLLEEYQIMTCGIAIEGVRLEDHVPEVGDEAGSVSAVRTDVRSRNQLHVPAIAEGICLNGRVVTLEGLVRVVGLLLAHEQDDVPGKPCPPQGAKKSTGYPSVVPDGKRNNRVAARVSRHATAKTALCIYCRVPQADVSDDFRVRQALFRRPRPAVIQRSQSKAGQRYARQLPG